VIRPRAADVRDADNLWVEEVQKVTVEAGRAAPEFDLPTAGGGRARLADFKGRPLVVYFYPEDDTPGCTKEAQGFAEAYPAFQAAGVAVVGISTDSAASHDRFKAKYDLPFTLASDERGGVIEAYGSWVEKSMYGKSYMGVDRSTFLIDRDDEVRHVWRKVNVPGHVAEVMAAARALNAP
jgi:thioredoxin-dependent peroxiredoxin